MTCVIQLSYLKCIYNVIFIIYNIDVNFTYVEKYYTLNNAIQDFQLGVNFFTIWTQYSLCNLLQIENATNEGSKSNLYFIIWFRIYYFTIRPRVFIMAFAITHIKLDETQICNLEVCQGYNLWSKSSFD